MAGGSRSHTQTPWWPRSHAQRRLQVMWTQLVQAQPSLGACHRGGTDGKETEPRPAFASVLENAEASVNALPGTAKEQEKRPPGPWEGGPPGGHRGLSVQSGHPPVGVGVGAHGMPPAARGGSAAVHRRPLCLVDGEQPHVRAEQSKEWGEGEKSVQPAPSTEPGPSREGSWVALRWAHRLDPGDQVLCPSSAEPVLPLGKSVGAR